VTNKSPEQKVNRAVDRSLRLLTEFLQLQERYALLHPMLFNESVQWQYGDRRQWHGFDALRRSLFLSCCQDIYKLSCDRSGHYCVSISKCVDDLIDGTVHKQLRQRYIAADLSMDAGYPDPVVAALDLARVPERTLKYGNDFDRKCAEIKNAWTAFLARPTLQACDTIRNELTAHTSFQLRRPTFDPVDIANLHVDFNDLKPTIDAMQKLVAKIGGVVQSKDFAWQHNEQRYITAAMDFWRDKEAVTR
jgi:hypothetical protein